MNDSYTITLESMPGWDNYNPVGPEPPTPSSSSTPTSSSSSEEDSTPIAKNSPLTTSNSPTYYSLKGEPLGSAKPQKAGIYIVKQGSSTKKIVVR
jgi:hypothetical protein